MPLLNDYKVTIDNRKRARWAQGAVNAFSVATRFGRTFNKLHRDDKADLVSDLLCDLMHFCKQNKIDFDKALKQGLQNFNIERTGTEW